MSIDYMSLDEAMGDKWRPGVHYVEQAQVRISILAAEVRRLRAERDELRAAGKLALARLCDGCYFETRDCPGNPEGCEAVRTLRAAIKGAAHE